MTESKDMTNDFPISISSRMEMRNNAFSHNLYALHSTLFPRETILQLEMTENFHLSYSIDWKKPPPKWQ